MKKFVNIPLGFKGVGGADIFKRIVVRVCFVPDKWHLANALQNTNAEGLRTVFRKSEALFMKLLERKSDFEKYTLLGMVDLDDFAGELNLGTVVKGLIRETDKNLKEMVDWDVNFRMLKKKSRELDQIPPEVRADCIRVSTSPLRSAVEDQLKLVRHGKVSQRCTS